MSGVLKPCPFCGDPHPVVMVNACEGTYVYYVLCKCGAMTKEHLGGMKAALEQAIAAWNTRAAQAEAVEIVREAREALRAIENGSRLSYEWFLERQGDRKAPIWHSVNALQQGLQAAEGGARQALARLTDYLAREGV